jgi:hypothetical protein
MHIYFACVRFEYNLANIKRQQLQQHVYICTTELQLYQAFHYVI